MADIQDLTIVDASNTARFPENQAPSTVNDGARALEGIVARWHKDTNGSKASTGSANAYIFAADQTLSAYYDGLTICFDANFTNTGAATLNVDAVSADPIVWPDQTALVSEDIVSGAKITVIHDGTSWQLVTLSEGVGALKEYVDATLVLGTEQATTSGTSIDFTGIPSGTKRITLQFAGVSTDGTDEMIVQLGDTGGFEATAYSSGSYDIAGAALATGTAGFVIATDAVADTIHGTMVLTLENSANFTWISTHNLLELATSIFVGGGSKSLSAELTQIRLTTTGGTDNFDAGAVNILYE